MTQSVERVALARRRLASVVLAVGIVAGSLLAMPVRAEAAAPTAAGAFVSLAPSRILDSRYGNGFSGPVLGNGGTVSLPVAGRGGVPASGVAAVVLNVTVTNTSAAGFITVYPSGAAMPNASNLNFSANQTIPNLVTVKLGGDGRVSLTNNSIRAVDLVADVAGYYLAGEATEAGTFVTLPPARILDSRYGNGYSGAVAGNGGTVPLQVTGRGGVPADGVGAVVMNVTVTNTKAAGFLTAYPTGTVRPNASNLNFAPGATIPNLVTVKVGSGGQVNLANSSTASVDLVADVAGYYLAGSPTAEGAFVPLAPARILDSRYGNGYSGAVAGNGGGCAAPSDRSRRRPGRGRRCGRDEHHRHQHFGARIRHRVSGGNDAT